MNRPDPLTPEERELARLLGRPASSAPPAAVDDAVLAAARAAVLYEVVAIFDRRRDEIIDWIIRESGSTRLKAQLEWGAARAIALESASFPSRVHGRIVESNVPGKESRVYRSALGVVGVISPWNFPLHLTQRSIAPALALGNAVVVKPTAHRGIAGAYFRRGRVAGRGAQCGSRCGQRNW